jgi:predicted dienelactone hydrolase
VSTLAVLVHVGEESVSAALTDDHAASYGIPVLVMADPTGPEGRDVAYQPEDLTSWGLASCLDVTPWPTYPEKDPRLLRLWNAAGAAYRPRLEGGSRPGAVLPQEPDQVHEVVQAQNRDVVRGP